MSESSPKWGVMSDEQLRALITGMIDPTATNTAASATAEAIIRLVRANTSCIGDMNRGCY